MAYGSALSSSRVLKWGLKVFMTDDDDRMWEGRERSGCKRLPAPIQTNRLVLFPSPPRAQAITHAGSAGCRGRSDRNKGLYQFAPESRLRICYLFAPRLRQSGGLSYLLIFRRGEATSLPSSPRAPATRLSTPQADFAEGSAKTAITTNVRGMDWEDSSPD